MLNLHVVDRIDTNSSLHGKTQALVPAFFDHHPIFKGKESGYPRDGFI